MFLAVSVVFFFIDKIVHFYMLNINFLFVLISGLEENEVNRCKLMIPELT